MSGAGVVGASSELGRDQNHRQMWVKKAQRNHRLNATHSRHADVEHDHIGLLGLKHQHRLIAIFGQKDAVALAR